MCIIIIHKNLNTIDKELFTSFNYLSITLLFRNRFVLIVENLSFLQHLLFKII